MTSSLAFLCTGPSEPGFVDTVEVWSPVVIAVALVAGLWWLNMWLKRRLVSHTRWLLVVRVALAVVVFLTLFSVVIYAVFLLPLAYC